MFFMFFTGICILGVVADYKVQKEGGFSEVFSWKSAAAGIAWFLGGCFQYGWGTQILDFMDSLI